MSLSIKEDDRYVVWFDIDNTLYSASSSVYPEMVKRTHAYFMNLGLSAGEASDLQWKYYRQYGLPLRGLVLNHDVDPLHFDKECDGSIPLEEMITFNSSVRKLLQDIDRSKARVWVLTNAYLNHAQRVLRILGLEDQVEGIAYCDYKDPNFTCKPEPAHYRQAMRLANVTETSRCLFVDDSKGHVESAKALGWEGCVHFCETASSSFDGGKEGTNDNGVIVINDLEQLRDVWPYIFINTKSASSKLDH
ncbi:pyrimidine 5-nucleotidase [Gymnopilus junonius]|uniref:Pyrimidine 5-nucleotidase n=1 Tax=Gymnopilus junonius TaxID=109634 RepID=A0A9P5NS72_GYMJU|nr:pyrimidine 5-nucleotidase [Gymnopilus junonius]